MKLKIMSAASKFLYNIRFPQKSLKTPYAEEFQALKTFTGLSVFLIFPYLALLEMLAYVINENCFSNSVELFFGSVTDYCVKQTGPKGY